MQLADLVGFTAWSSVREPSQVFILLETIFRAFDEIAVRRGIFKVETVGGKKLLFAALGCVAMCCLLTRCHYRSKTDCYVAVAGLPDPRKDHALVMAKFARDCIRNFGVLAKKLERTLGPGKNELLVGDDISS